MFAAGMPAEQQRADHEDGDHAAEEHDQSPELFARPAIIVGKLPA
jgi:hypothetical protein